MAWALYKQGRFSEALTAEKNALQFGTADPHQLYHASMIFSAAGNLKEGKQYLAKVAAINPAYIKSFHVHR
jgi:hypothetical protein